MTQVVWPPTCGQSTDVALVQKRLPGPGIDDNYLCQILVNSCYMCFRHLYRLSICRCIQLLSLLQNADTATVTLSLLQGVATVTLSLLQGAATVICTVTFPLLQGAATVTVTFSLLQDAATATVTLSLLLGLLLQGATTATFTFSLLQGAATATVTVTFLCCRMPLHLQNTFSAAGCRYSYSYTFSAAGCRYSYSYTFSAAGCRYSYSYTFSASGCRYSCVCHLCDVVSADDCDTSDLGQANVKTCNEEYCRLGCICDTVDSSPGGSKGHQPADWGILDTSVESRFVGGVFPDDTPTAKPGEWNPTASTNAHKRHMTSECNQGAKKRCATSGATPSVPEGFSQELAALLRPDVAIGAAAKTDDREAVRSVRKCSRLKNKCSIGMVDRLKSLIFFDTASWLQEDGPRKQKVCLLCPRVELVFFSG